MSSFERRTGRALAAFALACALPWLIVAAAPAATPPKAPSRQLHAPIAIAVNGDELPRNPAPRIVGKGGGRLVVPVVQIYSALGISVTRSGDAITASAQGKHWAILPPNAAYAQRCVDLGCRMLSLGLDVWAVQRGVRAFQKEYEAHFLPVGGS